jgi:hypothetical protein
MSATRDARWFFDELYRGKPDDSLIVITAKEGSGFGRSHFVQHADGALPYVLGVVDVYTRITVIGSMLRGRGRGKAEHSVALPGVWAELDVNGSPDGRGVAVTGAFPDLDAATEVATAVLEPTMLVSSGGGLHGYYLLEEMLRLTNADDRERAKALVQGFQERLRREAHGRFGVRKLDSTHDLARVFRPPGSVNGKGETPRTVELLDDGGRRYSIAEIEAVAVEIEEPTPAGENRRVNDAVESLLERHEDLTRLVNRKGTKPGDGSPSAWDYALGCRAAEHGYSDEVLAALFKHTRAKHREDKGQRPDYVARTVAAVRKRVAHVTADSTLDEVLSELTAALRLDGVQRRVVEAHVAGHGSTASVSIGLDDGYQVEFDQFVHVAQPDKLADQRRDPRAPATSEHSARTKRRRRQALHEEGSVTLPDWLFDELEAAIEDPDDLKARLTAWDARLEGAVEVSKPDATTRSAPTPVDIAAQVIACSLAGASYVIGRWWAAMPIKRGLAVAGITDPAVIDAALEQLGVEVRRQGATGARWKLDHVPQPRQPAETAAGCGCWQPQREWRLATGGPWTCEACHPPAGLDAAEIEVRQSATPPAPASRLRWKLGVGWSRDGEDGAAA